MDGELKDLLIKHHHEEMDDANTYSMLAQKAYEEDCEEVAGVLEDIAHDEMTHAKALSHILELGVM